MCRKKKYMVCILTIFLCVVMSGCEDAVDSVAQDFDTTKSITETSIPKGIDTTLFQGVWIATTQDGFLGENNTIKIEDATDGLKMVTYANPSASFEWHNYLLEEVIGGYHFMSDDIGIDFLITYDVSTEHLFFTDQKSLERETFVAKDVE